MPPSDLLRAIALPRKNFIGIVETGLTTRDQVRKKLATKFAIASRCKSGERGRVGELELISGLKCTSSAIFVRQFFRVEGH